MFTAVPTGVPSRRYVVSRIVFESIRTARSYVPSTVRGVPDAVVIGAGPNGLVAANVLADAGWEVVVLEEQDEPGGAVKTAELTEPGFRHDVFSAFYPLAAASPAIRSLRLERHGLEWCHGPLVFAHPARDGSCPFVSRDLDETAAALGADGERWRALYERWWLRVGDALLAAMA